MNLPGRMRALAPALLLAALTGAVFAPTAHNGFITLDDVAYISENPQVLRGLNRQTALWALRSTENANWYPLRRLTHLADASLFGMWAGGHHLVSVAWHAAAAVLLFLALRMMTGRAVRSLVIAAIFAVHPLQVESVAWASERSNVLAGFFFGLTLLTWARYARRPGIQRYAAAALSLAGGLMAKPTLMTVPPLLVLLDFWPLGRLGLPGAPLREAGAGRLRRCLLEKVPLVVLAAASGAVTLILHQRAGALPALEALPLSARLGNAMLSYCQYLGKMLWPAGLAVYYPHRGADVPTGVAVLAGTALVTMTVAVLVQWPRRPWLGAGWLWYLGMLVPTIGIVQFSSHAMADRFAYLPSTGCFLAAVWLVSEELQRLRVPTVLRVATVVVTLAGFGISTIAQARLWKESRPLFEHALAVTRDNWMAHLNLGMIDAQEGRLAAAEAHFRETLRIRPLWFEASSQLAPVLVRQGRVEEGILMYGQALRARPKDAQTLVNLGAALDQAGRHSEALGAYRLALSIDPGLTEGQMNLGNALSDLGRTAEALQAYAKALQLAPVRADIFYNRALALERVRRFEEAARDYREALRLEPGHHFARDGLARVGGGNPR